MITEKDIDDALTEIISTRKVLARRKAQFPFLTSFLAESKPEDHDAIIDGAAFLLWTVIRFTQYTEYDD